MSLADDIIGGNYNPKKRKLADDIIKGTYKPTSVLDDIAPVKTTVTQPVEEKKDTGIFSKGAFSDGYDFGDVTKSILGTGLDVVTNTAKSLFGIGESAGDLINYGIAGVADLLGNKDFAENLKNETSKSLTNEIFSPAENLYDKTSLLGEFSDNVVQGIGYYAGLLGLKSVGIPWQVTAGVSSGGNEMSEAFQNGATTGEALFSSILSAGAEIGSEYLFGGLKLPKTGKTSEALFGGMVDNIKNKALKALAGFGINAVGEGLEEIISGWANNVAKNLTYMKDEDKNIFQNAIKGTTDYYSKNAWNDLIMGSLVTAITNGASPQTWNNIKTGRNLITGYTANEQSIIDQEVSNKMAEAEKNGKKLTNKEKSAIEEQVKEDLQKGYISTDTIESTLGGDTYNQLQELKNQKQSIQDEITRLENKPNAEITVAENEKLQDLRNQIKEMDNKKLETKLNDELKIKIENDNYLKQSYIEKALKGEKFSYDANKVTNENAKAVYESASKVVNNSNRSHEFVDKVAKLAADRGTKYLFTNNEEIANGKYNIKGKTINGFIDENGNVLININSDKALNTILGHETTHLLEGTKEYKELQEAAIEYAKMKNDYQNRVDSLNELYKNVENADINNELTADIIGDYLFTDENFINNLSTKKPTLFTKIKNLIDDLVVRFKGTKEERQLRELQRKFEKAYRQNSTNTDSKYSITDKIQGLENYSKDEIKNIANDYIMEKLEENGYYSDDIKIINSEIHGSRGRGTAKTNSDLDIVVQYDGDIREDDLFNILNNNGDENLYINGIEVDINPIQEDIEEYMKRSNEYDQEILNNIENQEDLGYNIIERKQRPDFTKALGKKEWHDFYEKIDNHGTEDKQPGSKNKTIINDKIILSEHDGKKPNVYEVYQAIDSANDIAKNYNLTTEDIIQDIYELMEEENVDEGTIKNRLEKYFNQGLLRRYNSNDNVFVSKNEKTRTNIESDIRNIREQQRGKDNLYQTKQDRELENSSFSLAEQLEQQGTKILEEAENKRQAMIENFKEYLEENSITKPTQQDIDDSITDLLSYDNEQSAADNAKDEKLYNQYVREYMKENNIPFKDTKYSLSEDNQGRELSKQQQEYFKDSKVRDENGNLETVYHQTKNEFTEFKNGFSMRGFKNANFFTNIKPNQVLKYMMEGYVNITNPLYLNDTSIQQNIIDDAIEQGYDGIINQNVQGKEGLNEIVAFNSNQFKNVDNENPTTNPDIRYSLSPSGEMVDNTTGEKIKLNISESPNGNLMVLHNINEDKFNGILDLDGIPVPSLAITDPEVVNFKDFGEGTLIFTKDTIDPKIAANEVYDRDVWSPTFPQVDYELNDDGIEKVANNLGIEEWRLRDAAEDNSKPEYLIERLLREEKLIDKYINDNNIDYETAYKDAETRVDFHQRGEKIRKFIIDNDFDFRKLYKDKKLQQEYFDLIKDYYDNSTLPEAVKENIYNEKITQLKDYVDFQEGAGDLEPVRQLKRYQDDFDLIKSGENKVIDEWQTKKNKKDAAINNGIEDYLKEQVKDVYGDKGIRNDREIFTPSGNRRSFWQLHDEYNLENIVNALTKGETTGTQNWIAGYGQIQANMANRFNSIEEIKANQNKITSLAENNELLEEARNNIENDIDEISARNDTENYVISELLADFARGDLTVENFKKLTRDYYQTTQNVPDSLINKIINDLNTLKDLPTDYFEAKPQRAVDLDEIGVAVIPNNWSKETKQRINEKGITYFEYDPKIEGDRQRVINQFDNLKFSLSNNIAPIGNYNVYGKDIKYQVEDAIAPLQDTIYDLSNQVEKLQNDIAPVRTEVENNVPKEKTERDIIAERILNDKVRKAIQNQSYKAVNMAAKKGQEFFNFDQAEKKQFKNELSKYIGKTREEIISAATWNDVKDIVSNYTNREIKYVDEELKSIKDEIRKRRIKVTDNLKNQITDYNDFRRSNFGKLKLGSEGNNIDSLYQELSNSYPYYFGEANTEADMLYELSDFMNQDITVTDKYKLTDEDIEDYTNKIFNLLKDNTMSSETIEELQNKLEKKINTRTREVIQQELLDDMGVTLDDIAQGKDISAIDSFRTDPIRLNEKVFGYETGNKINDATIRKTKHNEAERIRWLNKERQEIKDLGIKAFSKESAAVQKYAEKEYVNDQGEVVPYGDMNLMREFKNAETREKIKHAAEVLRGKYDTYIDQINKTLTDMGYTPIAKRKDYMRHFQALNDIFSRFGTPLNKESMQSDALPTDINGLTDQFKPGKQYFANALKRLGMKTQYDAITGIDGYLDGASNLIYHTEDIQRYRALSKLIRNTYGQTHGFDDFANMTPEQQAERVEDIQSNKLSKYAAWLDEQANALAGKKGGIDRAAERILGRKIYNVLNTAKKQVGSNMTGYNVRSALTNFASAVQGASKTNKLAFIKGTLSTMNNIINHDGLIDKSDFLTSRFGSENLSQKLWQRLSNKGQIFMSGTDYFTANQIWRSKYFENLQKGMTETDAIKNADDFAARIMGDRSKGSTAEAFNSKTLGLLTQFQLEVNNQWSSLIHDNKIDVQNKNKTMSSMLFQTGQLFALSYLFNNFMKSLTGSKVMIDPVDLFKKIFAPDDDDERTIEERAREAFGDIIDDLPFVSFFTGGGRIPVSEAFQGANSFLDYLTGQNNSYGQPVTFDDAVDDTIESAFYWLLPTGYGQAKKTVGGLSMFDENLPVKGSYTDSGRLRYPVEDTPTNRIQAGLFGKWANKNAQDYLNRKESSLTEKQIDEFSKLDMPIQEYWDYSKGLKEARAEGKENGNQTEAIFEYINSLDATNEQKNIMINSNTNRKKEIDMSNYDDYGSYEEFDFATKNEEKYNYLEKNNISYKEYTSSDETKKAYDYAYNNRNKKDFNTKMTNYVNKLNLTSKDKKKILSKFGIKS